MCAGRGRTGRATQHVETFRTTAGDLLVLTDDIRGFVFAHRVHGTVTTKASAETETGLRLRCTCGQAYYVYVTPEIAAEDFRAQAERS